MRVGNKKSTSLSGLPLSNGIQELVIRHSRLESGESVLLIGDQLEDLCQKLQSSCENIECEAVPEKTVVAASQYRSKSWSLVIYAHRSAVSRDKKGSSIVAFARDLIGQRVLHVVINRDAQPNCWLLADSLALGFSWLENHSAEEITTSVYEFSIQNYKLQPDWLNSGNWANPQMWDRRW